MVKAIDGWAFRRFMIVHAPKRGSEFGSSWVRGFGARNMRNLVLDILGLELICREGQNPV